MTQRESRKICKLEDKVDTLHDAVLTIQVQMKWIIGIGGAMGVAIIANLFK